MRVTVVVIAWNPGARIDACLDALHAQDHGDVEAMVVDNASGDGTAARVAERHPWAKLVANPTNRGFAGAANQGFELGSGEAVMTLNPDVVLEPTPDILAGLGRAKRPGLPHVWLIPDL